MKNYKNLSIVVFLTLFVIFLFGCEVAEKPATETTEEAIDTGALLVESSPGLAQVYVGEEYRGDTPLNLYNLPVGNYDITIKKEGYLDFKKTVVIKVGRTEKLDVTLTQLAPKVEEKKPAEKAEEVTPKNVSVPQLNKINLSSFAMYYDFEKMQFTEARTDKSDLFSRKYENYVHFTALTPAKVYVLNKPVKDVQKEDCLFGENAVAIVYSGQTLCVNTLEGSVVAIGSEWKTSPTELEWVLFS